MNDLRPLALAVAHSDARRVLREAGGSNKGTYVEFILRNAGVDVPAPWCAAWIQDIYDSAALALGRKSPLDDVKLEAYVMSYYEWGKKEGRIIGKASDIVPGDLVLFNFGGERYDHIAIVLVPPQSLAHGEVFQTIEGNTNDAGGREGDRVKQKTRKIVAARNVFISMS